MERWYVAATHVGQERLACEGLERQGFETFLPFITERWVERGKVHERRRPAFGSYAFVGFDVDADRWRSVNGTRGVVRLLPVGHEVPTAVPTGMVEAIRCRLEVAAKDGGFTYDEVVDVMLDYAPGDAVPIVEGTLAGHTGMFMWQRNRSVKLLLSVLGAPREVTVHAHQVQRPASQALR